ncbi:tRNA1(Val) A37 N6-methylase TrmN6 [Pseudoxanthobacter soli DSM 19599]|uniref:tRNA1(Val) A37 N6-methylase TrmN6 n=1 Tax=Pseudoxanthobacter soli DSM 19599 TaxID=1123029 RepID=A0A1M7Z3Y9_9HYPH|nr:methyltransferase [Pseudoxanthobacter soli]SHO59663.1 tRNA1(Val) A37 N6-methylase TrmN6 [Pseudoxanthobacter soli DSM 19599]
MSGEAGAAPGVEPSSTAAREGTADVTAACAAGESTASADATGDAFLGGRFRVLQPPRGRHRSGHDALLLAASVPEGATGRCLDLGAGVGVAGLAVAVRCPGLSVDLVEIDSEAAALARRSLALPANAALGGRVRVIEADITVPSALAAAGLEPHAADIVVMNPPFYAAGRVRASPDARRATAHVLGEAGLDPWLRAAARLLRPGGLVSIIFPASGLDEVLEGCRGRFGAAVVVPVHARADAPALRVIVRAVAGSRGPMTLAPGLVLHDGTGPQPSNAARAVLEQAAPLPGLPAVANKAR